VLNDPVNLVDPLGLVSLYIIWRNRPFIFHYFFGGGRPMNIQPNSDLGQKMQKHLSKLIFKRYQEAISNACENYQKTIIDEVDFTNNPDLFSLGNSNLKTRIFCGNCRCLIRFEVHDWFRDVKDINDTIKGNQEYLFGQPYPISFIKVYTYGF